MMRKVSIIFTICWFVSTSFADGFAPEALFVQLKSGENTKAVLPLLTSAPRQSEFFVWSVLETAKLHYKEGRWPQFFGIAHFNRIALAASLHSEELRLLEIIALLRHCQEEKAKTVWQSRPLTNDKTLKDKYLVLAELLQIEVKNDISAPSQNPSETPSTKVHAWPVSGMNVASLNPHRLSRKIKGLCVGRGAK